jgi:ankyrin repeat protein
MALASCTGCNNIAPKKPRTVSADEVRAKARDKGIIIDNRGKIVPPYPDGAGILGEYIIHYAIIKGADTQLIKYLLEELNEKYSTKHFKSLLNNRDKKSGKNPFRCAVDEGYASIIQLLLDYGVTPTEEEIKYAVKQSINADNTVLLAHIIEAGKKVNFKLDIPNTLYRAANESKVNLMEYILKMPNVDINTQDNEGNSILHIAVLGDNEKVVRVLIEQSKKRLNLNIRNNQGETPLILAIKLKSLPIVSTLLREEADLNLPDRNGRLPLEIAKQQLQNQRAKNEGVAHDPAPQAIVNKILLALRKSQSR